MSTDGSSGDAGADQTPPGLNAPFDAGDQAYIIVSAAMVLLMVPGIAFLYSGLARRKSALSLIWVTMMSFSVVVFQWYFWGYSLALSSTATNGFIGNLDKFGLRNTLAEPSPGSPLIPELLYSFYQVRKKTHREMEDGGRIYCVEMGKRGKKSKTRGGKANAG